LHHPLTLFNLLASTGHEKCIGMDEMRLSATKVLETIETPVLPSLKEQLRAINKEEK